MGFFASTATLTTGLTLNFITYQHMEIELSNYVAYKIICTVSNSYVMTSYVLRMYYSLELYSLALLSLYILSDQLREKAIVPVDFVHLN